MKYVAKVESYGYLGRFYAKGEEIEFEDTPPASLFELAQDAIPDKPVEFKTPETLAEYGKVNQSFVDVYGDKPDDKPVDAAAPVKPKKKK